MSYQGLFDLKLIKIACYVMPDSPIPLQFHAFEIYFEIIFDLKGVFIQLFMGKICFIAEIFAEKIWLVI